MSRCLSHAFLASLAISFLGMVVAGCDNRPKRLSPTKVDAATAATEAMAMYDTNQDGRISGSELDKCPSLKAIAKDGTVTADFIKARITDWQESRIGRGAVSIAIFHNGKGLPGASVKLTPEKFLGTDIHSAAGTTGPMGAAIISVPTSGPGEPLGASLGFYRVEVAKDGESIPAKYNAETTLGIAVLGGDTSTSFNLVY